jgi:hypothetical protein
MECHATDRQRAAGADGLALPPATPRNYLMVYYLTGCAKLGVQLQVWRS